MALGAVLLGLPTIFFSLWASQRKKAAANPAPPGPAAPAPNPLQR